MHGETGSYNTPSYYVLFLYIVLLSSYLMVDNTVYSCTGSFSLKKHIKTAISRQQCQQHQVQPGQIAQGLESTGQPGSVCDVYMFYLCFISF